MAKYEYKCENEHLYTETRPITEDQKQTECIECGKKLLRIYAGSAPAIRFKGGGFYSNGG